ncbi:MAG: glycosyltransferase [Candidatus Micrarchaeota archaeon]
MHALNKYAEFSGHGVIDAIRREAGDLEGKSFVHVNSTYYGGGVAEMLNSYVPMLNDAGVSMDWRLLKGSKEFFFITKKLHNALQGKREMPSAEEIAAYEETVATNAKFSNLRMYDCVIIDDPQPAPLVNHFPRSSPALWKPLPLLLELEAFQRRQPWVWRAHIDMSNSYPPALELMRKYISKYDAAIVSLPSYAKNLGKPFFVIPPAIDPLSEKNRPMTPDDAERLLGRFGVDCRKPIVAQISRFDPWKDPLGVIAAFKSVRKKAKCQLVMLGSHAADDPESETVFQQVFRIAEKEKDVALLTVQSDMLVNALQRKASVIVQKSVREGFGLTVSEALWKGTPVVASRVGGIPLQVDDGLNGFLVTGTKQCADRISYLLKNPATAKAMGAAGAEKVRRNFLMPRLVLDEIRMLKKMTKAGKTIRPPKAVEAFLGLLKKTPRIVRRGLKLLAND